MKSKLPSKGDLVKVNPRWRINSEIAIADEVGIVMEVERQVPVGMDDMNDPIYEDGCWVMFPSAGDLWERTRWHWLEHYRLRLVSES